MKHISIGEIGNQYGGLYAGVDSDGYWWGIEDYNGCVDWERIPKSLYDELVLFERAKEGVSDG